MPNGTTTAFRPHKSHTTHAMTGMRAKALANMRAHMFCHNRLSARSSMLALPLLLCSSITSTIAVTAVGEEGKPHHGMTVALAVMSCIVSLIGSLQNFYKFEARARDHLNTGRQLQELLSVLDQEILCGLVEDGDSRMFIQRISLQVHNVYKMAPAIPMFVLPLFPAITGDDAVTGRSSPPSGVRKRGSGRRMHQLQTEHNMALAVADITDSISNSGSGPDHMPPPDFKDLREASPTSPFKWRESLARTRVVSNKVQAFEQPAKADAVADTV